MTVLKVRADHPVDPGLHAMLVHAKAATQALGIKVFVGGAMNRYTAVEGTGLAFE